MGEAKRRKELGLPPKAKKEMKTRTKNKSSSSQFSINNLRSNYPAAPFVTTALVLLALQFGFSLNSWNQKLEFFDEFKVIGGIIPVPVGFVIFV